MLLGNQNVLGILQLPFEIDLVQLVDALESNIRLGTLMLEKLVVPSLALDPRRKLRILGIERGNVCVTEAGLKLQQLFKALTPSRFLGTPAKSNVLQSTNALGNHGRRLTRCQELVLVPIEQADEVRISSPLSSHDAHKADIVTRIFEN
jgi:hypothetical protein